MSESEQRRFAAFVAKSRGCWIWRGARAKNGYGVFTAEGRQQKAHRLAYKLWRGPIPVGLLVCHACDVRACVKPSHLFVGSQRDNVRDMRSKGRDRPPRGEINAQSKLRDRDVHRILEDAAPAHRVARALGVSLTTVNEVRRGRRWAHVGRAGIAMPNWKDKHGERNSHHKLTAQHVRAIRASREKMAILAARYGVSCSLIEKVRRGVAWSHVR